MYVVEPIALSTSISKTAQSICYLSALPLAFSTLDYTEESRKIILNRLGRARSGDLVDEWISKVSG